MLVVQSYFTNTKHFRSNINLVYRQASLSCRFLKKHKYEVVLYTSEQLKNDVFKNIPYDNIISLDIEQYYDIINLNNFWSFTKLLSVSNLKEPFYHIDTDLFLLENILEPYIEHDFLMFHKEPWINTQIKNNISLPLINSIFNIELSDIMSYNAAIFGGKNIDMIQSEIVKIINILNNNKHLISNIFLCKNQPNYDWLPSVLFEQVLLPSLIANHVKNISTIINADHCKNFWNVFDLLKKIKVIHLWNAKQQLNHAIGINNLCDYIESYYF